MTTFLILLIVCLGLGMICKATMIYTDYVIAEVRFVALLIRAGLIVWASILLGMN